MCRAGASGTCGGAQAAQAAPTQCHNSQTQLNQTWAGLAATSVWAWICALRLRLPRQRHATLAPGYRLGGTGTCGRGARAAAAGAGGARAAAQAAQAPPHPGLLDVQRAHKRCPPRAPARSATSPGSNLLSGLLRGRGDRELEMGCHVCQKGYLLCHTTQHRMQRKRHAPGCATWWRISPAPPTLTEFKGEGKTPHQPRLT